MNVLIYGAGVIGSIFAAKLCLSGQNVTVLARGKRLEEIRDTGRFCAGLHIAELHGKYYIYCQYCGRL